MELQKLFKEKINSTKIIEEGFSLDKKYIINNKYVVRVISKERIDQFKKVLVVQQNFSKVSLCQRVYRLVEDKTCGYYITEYLKGKNGLEVIQSYPKEKQYELGIIAAKEIVKFHKAYPLPNFDVISHFKKYFNNKINKVRANSINTLVPEIEDIINVVSNNIHHFYKLRGVQTHADYHLFNMIFDDGEYKGVIDFERVRPGIFLTDFRNNTPHNSPVSPAFASGYIDGYLREVNIKDFFLLYNIHDLLISIASIPWTLEYNPKNIENAINQVYMIYNQRNSLSLPPRWYIGELKQ